MAESHIHHTLKTFTCSGGGYEKGGNEGGEKGGLHLWGKRWGKKFGCKRDVVGGKDTRYMR